MKLYSNAANRAILESLPGLPLIWEVFGLLCATPRESGNTEKILPALKFLAENLGFAFKIEPESNNVLLRKAADPGFEDLPVVAFQCHMDMVAEKLASSSHDFSKDEIELRVKESYLMANNTTLGADNGIGIALSAALMATEKTGAIELLITTDEETSMGGAQALKKGFCSAKWLVNVDSEDDSYISVGCAGAAGFDFSQEIVYEATEASSWKLVLANLTGGHSGVDINKNRGNAIKILAMILAAGQNVDEKLRLVDISAGKQPNAIPREAAAEIIASSAALAEMKRVFSQIQAEFSLSDPKMSLEITPSQTSQVFSQFNSDSLINLLNIAFSGVFRGSVEVPGQTETSNNLASVKIEGNSIKIVNFCRSSIDDSLDRIFLAAKIAAKVTNFEITELYDRFPGWKPDFNSELLAITKRCVEKIYGESVIEAGHYGLECAFILANCAELEAVVSVGPTIKDPHSISERLKIDSVSKCYELLKEILEGIYEKK